MKKRITSLNYFTRAMALFVILFSSLHCASQGGGNTPFNISTDPTALGALSISQITVASNIVQINTTYSADVTFTGSSLTGIVCTWSLTNSVAQPVGTPVSAAANTNNVCVQNLTAPATAGSYTLQVSATNSLGQTTIATLALTVQTTPPPPSTSLSLTASPSTAYVNLTQVSFTGTLVTNVSGNYSVVVGTVSGSTFTPISGCTSGVTVGTNLTFDCSTTFSVLGNQDLYIALLNNGANALTCTGDTSSCQGNYIVDVIQKGGGGGGGGGGCGGGQNQKHSKMQCE